jgi:hypothetical protein
VALERPPCHRVQGGVNRRAFFRGERFGFSIPAGDCLNDSLHPYTDSRAVRIEQEFHEQFLPYGGHDESTSPGATSGKSAPKHGYESNFFGGPVLSRGRFYLVEGLVFRDDLFHLVGLIGFQYDLHVFLP